MDVTGCCVDDTLISSDLLLDFLNEMMIIKSEHAHNRHTREGGREGGADN